MPQGWIKLHRKLLDWEWYHDSKMVHLFLHLLFLANREPGRWKGVEVQRGQLLTGLSALSKATGLTSQNIRTCLKKLEKSKILTNKSTNRFRIITICKYNSYQDTKVIANKPPNKQLTSYQQATNNPANSKQEVKKSKKDKNKTKTFEFVPTKEQLKETFEEARKLYKGSKTGLENEWKNFTKKYNDYSEIIPLLKPAIEKQIAWRKEAEKEEGVFVPHWKNFQTWINNGCWTLEFAESALTTPKETREERAKKWFLKEHPNGTDAEFEKWKHE